VKEAVAAGVISWEYATTNWNEEAIKVAVALNGIGPFISFSFLNIFKNLFDLIGPVAVSVDASRWDFYRWAFSFLLMI